MQRILLFLSIEIYHNENFNLWKSHICIPKSIKYLSKKKKKKVRSKNNITTEVNRIKSHIINFGIHFILFHEC